MLILLIVLILVVGQFGGWGWNHEAFGGLARGGVGLGTILVVVLIILLLTGRL